MARRAKLDQDSEARLASLLDSSDDIVAAATSVQGIPEKVQATLEAFMASLDDLKAAVKRNSDVVDSAVLLINGIADRIRAAGTDPAELAALASEVDGDASALAAAVAANTPAAPPVTPVEPVPSAEPPVESAPADTGTEPSAPSEG